jgi:hypothetical protein
MIALICVTGSSAQPLGLCGRLDEISRKATPSEQDYNEAKQILDTIARESAPGDPEVMHSLLVIALDENRSALVSFPAISVLCQKADQGWADRLVAAMHERAAIMANVPFKRSDTVHGNMAGLLGTFVEDCAEQLLPKLSNARPMFDVLSAYSMLDPRWLELPTKQKALRVIATANVDLAIRREYALKLIKVMPRDPAPDGFEKLFSQEDIPVLRSIAVASRREPTAFNYGAAGLLAHLGDEGTLPALRAFLQSYAKGKPTPEGMILWYIWQIENQHPPSKLLVHIKSGERFAADSRVWAMERALDYKIDKTKIREAILEHAREHVDDHSSFRFELYGLKQRAMKLGVLQENDLPNVKAPSTHEPGRTFQSSDRPH